MAEQGLERQFDSPETEPSYRLYGRVWSSDENLDHLLPRASATPEAFYRLSRGEEPDAWRGDALVYESPIPDSEGNPRLKIWRGEGRFRAFFSSAGAYHLGEDSITCYPVPGVAREVRDNLLLGALSAFWLELRHTPTLHASAVSFQGEAVAFASHSRGGKSGLAAVFMRAGHPLLTDDILPLRREGRQALAGPGYPMMRMWPDEAAQFLAGAESLPRVHPRSEKLRVRLPEDGFGTFQDRPLALRRIYFPTWLPVAAGPAPVQIQPLPPREGLVELVRFSFAARVARALGLEPERFELLSQVARQVPLRRLLYPKGFEFLEHVRKAVEEDLRAG